MLKCLAKNAKDRPKSAAQLAQALEWIPTDAWGDDQAKKWWETNTSTPISSGPPSPNLPLYQPAVTNSRINGV